MDDRAPQPDEIEIDYIQEDVRFDTTNPHYAAFQQVFEAFKISEPDKDGSQQMETEEKAVVELINILQGLLCYFIVTVRKRRVERVTRLMMKAL
jgi:hypothetical protein